VGTFLHIVSDLDQSLAFYHDKLGLELTGPSGEHKFTDNPAVANLYGVPGKQFRVAVVKIPGSEMGIELVQWGEARTASKQPGGEAVALIIRRDAAKATLEDPDGLPVEIEPATNPGADLRVNVADMKTTRSIYTSALGFKADGEWLSVPGSSVRIHLIKAARSAAPPFPEPGEGMLRLRIRGMDALVASLKSAGFSVITTGGAPVTLPQGPRVIILRDPNNFYLQLMEAR
jgi:catechol 2,3-dioxygenase-like lactoylglutathione lyase family enzyme